MHFRLREWILRAKMHQLPPELWNQIARESPPQTEAGKLAFRLIPDSLERMLDVWAQMEKEAKTPKEMIVPLMEVLPLLEEQAALSQFKARHPEFLAALPEVLSPQEAAALMTRERQWSPAQSSNFLALLQSGQPQMRWLKSAKALHPSA